MNEVLLIGRLTKNSDIRLSQDGSKKVARYTLAVDRAGKDNEADFISCVAFDKTADFVEKHLTKGVKIAVRGHIHTGSYTNRDGQKVYTTDVYVDNHYFCESKRSMNDINADIEFDEIQEELPFV